MITQSQSGFPLLGWFCVLIATLPPFNPVQQQNAQNHILRVLCIMRWSPSAIWIFARILRWFLHNVKHSYSSRCSTALESSNTSIVVSKLYSCAACNLLIQERRNRAERSRPYEGKKQYRQICIKLYVLYQTLELRSNCRSVCRLVA